MSAATVQWQAVGGITHAWLTQGQGYISLCGREVVNFAGQQSGLRCAVCAVSSNWTEQTWQSSYLTPHQYPLMPQRLIPRCDPVLIIPSEETVYESQTEVPSEAEDRQASEVEPTASLMVPDTIDAYWALPETEQRYWAPLMLRRLGHDMVWNPDMDTAEQFQQRCYARLKECYEISETPREDG